MPINYGNPIDPNTIHRGEINGAAPNQLGGYYNYGLANSLANQYGVQGSRYGNRQIGNEMSSQSASGEADARNAQLAALEQQRLIAGGYAPSVAEKQYQQGMQASMRGQQAQAASMGGGGNMMAAAQRAAAFNNNETGITGRNDLVGIRANEIAAARDRYAQGLAALRQGDQGMWSTAQGRELTQAGLNDQGMLQSQGMAGQMLQGQLNADSASFAADEAARAGRREQAKADRDRADNYKMAIAKGGLSAATLGAF